MLLVLHVLLNHPNQEEGLIAINKPKFYCIIALKAEGKTTWYSVKRGRI